MTPPLRQGDGPASAPSWRDLLRRAGGLPPLEARALLEHASGRAREWLIAHDDEAADDALVARFDELVRRRAAGEPLAYLTGWREFYGRRFAIGRAVLIPRPDTELLVELALALAAPGARALDLGTGSGCIAVTMAIERPDLRMSASDISEAALDLARHNARTLGALSIRWHRGDWWRAVAPGERFDLVVANPPYVAAGDPHLREGDLRFEPARALTDGADGLGAIRAIIAGCPAHLAPGARLLLEHGFEQGEAVRALLREAGLSDVATERDLEGRQRVTRAQARI